VKEHLHIVDTARMHFNNTTWMISEKTVAESTCGIAESRIGITNWQSCHLVARIRADVGSRLTNQLMWSRPGCPRYGRRFSRNSRRSSIPSIAGRGSLPPRDLYDTNLGSIYLVPVHTYITTQDDFFEVHVSSHNKKKELIDAGDYEKGKHQHPELCKKQTPATRKKQNPATRKLRAAEDRSGWKQTAGKRQSDAALLQECQHRFTKLGGQGSASPIRAVALLAFTIPNSEPDFGFGVDPGRLRGYPLAHLAGTWR
jgi:hypothetical protein